MANILIVDDDAQTVQQVGRQLTKAGHQCRGAVDGKNALRMLDKHPIDLAILDVMLPRISGFEVCRRIRSNPEIYTLPVIFVSAMNSEEEINHGLAQGADDYLTKPINLEMLVNRTEGLLATATESALLDSQTSLPGPKGTKLEIQKAVNSRTPFALTYVELLGMNHLTRLGSPEARTRVLRRFARRLVVTGKELASDVFRAGHMGGGHFVCITETSQAEQFCQRICQRWAAHIPDLFEALSRDKQLNGAAGREEINQVAQLLSPACFVTLYEGDEGENFRSLFDTLSRLRQSAVAQGQGGVFFDRRGTWAPPPR